MDYAETNDSMKREDGLKLIIGRDKWTKHTFAHLVQMKGLGDNKVAKKVLKSIGETGNTRMRLKTDGEPALIQVQEKITEERNHETIPENPPAHDPQCNGEAERAVQEVKAQLRALKLGLEYRIKKDIPPNSPILEWMVPHAAFVINKFLVGKDGRTPHYRIYNRNFGAKTYEISEQVMVKPKRRRKDNKKRSLAARCVEATWTGFETRSNEHFVILKDGGPAIKVRTVKPRAEGDRWSADAIFKIMATPDAPNPLP